MALRYGNGDDDERPLLNLINGDGLKQAYTYCFINHERLLEFITVFFSSFRTTAFLLFHLKK